MDNKRKQASTSVTKEGRTYSTSRDLGGLMSDPQKRKTARPEGVSNREAACIHASDIGQLQTS